MAEKKPTPEEIIKAAESEGGVVTPEVTEYVNAKLAVAAKGNDLRFNALQNAIEEVNKTAEGASDSVVVSKPEKPAPPKEVKVGRKTYRAKGNSFKVPNKSGGTDKIDLTKMDEKEIQQVQKDHPSMFVEVD